MNENPSKETVASFDSEGLLFKARTIDPKGRCCGRKPIHYKRDGGPHLFCPRCSRAYDVDSGHQIPNWAFKVYDPTTFRAFSERVAEGARK